MTGRARSAAARLRRRGICHVVVPQHGHVRPGMFCVGGDSHFRRPAARSALTCSASARPRCSVVVSGEIWLQVPRTITLRWHGQLAERVSAKDTMLHLIALRPERRRIPGGRGSTATRCARCHARAHDARQPTPNSAPGRPDRARRVTRDWLAAAGAPDCEIDGWCTDAGPRRRYAVRRRALAPQVAAPHSPANARPVDEIGHRAVDIAYVGACTGAKLVDLRAAASVLRGRASTAGCA